MPISLFPKLPVNVVNDLSTDQYHAYWICWAVINRGFGDWTNRLFKMANFGMQNFAILYVFGRTISDPKSFVPFLLNRVFSNLI